MKLYFSLIISILFFTQSIFAQKMLDTTSNRVKTDYAIDLKRIGTLKTKNTSEIKSSNWLIGCETLDRDLADYDQYKEYIAPLGIKRLRMQAGWAKTEKVKGQYNWAWLDKIIDDAHARGFEVWLETSYGNPIYEGGGGINLSAGIPTSEVALAAWDKWVEALVIRYRDKVKDWEVWNEPNFGDNEYNTPEQVAELNIRTAVIIKKHQPTAKISGLSMGHINLEYADRFFKVLHKKKKMKLFDNMTYHDYYYNPDANYPRVAALRCVLDKYAPNVKLRQGENGCPSGGGGGRGALGDYEWTELSQAKWNSRRLLSDLGHDLESSILGIIEMNYGAKNGPVNKMNYKGIMVSNEKLEVVRPKMVYYAMQHITSIFDDNLQRIKQLEDTNNSNATLKPNDVKYHRGTDRSLAVYAYEHKTTKKQVFTIWQDDNIPLNTNTAKIVDFTILNANFDNPVYVDILTGGIYEIPTNQIVKKGNIYTFKSLPVYDAPILIVDKSILKRF